MAEPGLRAARRRVPILSESLIARCFPEPPPDDESAHRLVGEAVLAASLAALLDGHEATDGLWLFGYGSLIWRPEIEFAERRVATVRGWHRRFCLWQWRFRGTPDRPGLMLALDRGGACKGVAYRIAGPDIRTALAPVWRREMRGRGYLPRWVRAETAAGPVRALTFVVNRRGERYAGRLSEAEAAAYIAQACGHAGPSASYLLATVAACEELGIRDPHLWRLQELVAARMAAAQPEAGDGVAGRDGQSYMPAR